MRRTLASLILAATLASSSGARAQPTAGEQQAREAFLQGVALVREERWSDALRAFDRSVADRPHPVTYYNMALCHRALGRPVRAVFALERALSEGEAGGERLGDDKLPEARALLATLRQKRSFVVLDLLTDDATLTVDGQPVERLGDLVVPSLAAGAPSPLSPQKLRLALDPGGHTLRIAREGHAPWTREATFGEGETEAHAVSLRLLPATLAVRANVEGARIRLGAEAPAPLPLQIERAPGPLRLEVNKSGYLPFVSEVTLRPGVRTDVLADLRLEKVPITKKWWFYAGIGVAVVAAGVTTYALTRPTEKADGGSLGFVARP